MIFFKGQSISIRSRTPEGTWSRPLELLAARLIAKKKKRGEGGSYRMNHCLPQVLHTHTHTHRQLFSSLLPCYHSLLAVVTAAAAAASGLNQRLALHQASV